MLNSALCYVLHTSVIDFQTSETKLVNESKWNPWLNKQTNLGD